MEKLFLIDAYALIFRFHYAFINRPMRNAQGLNTSAIFGFAKFLNEIIAREQPKYLGVAFDPPGGSFRRELYPLYKANRDATPEDIIAAVPHIKAWLEAMRIPVLEVPDYEADDVIGTLSHRASCCGEYDVYMVTPDKDYGQLIKENVSMYKPAKGGEGIDIVGLDKVCETYGIADPKQVIDILALWGDASDNIPGVPGIGEKGAKKLVAEWGDVENIIAHADSLTPKLRTSVLDNQEQLRLSKVLATIRLDVPIDFDPTALRIDEPDYAALRSIYIEHNFSLLLRDLDSRLYHSSALRTDTVPPLSKKPGKPKPYSQLTGQMSLFGEPETAPATVAEPLPDPVVPPTPALSEEGTPEAGYATLATTEHRYRIVSTDTELAALVAELERAEKFCFDTETSGIDPLRSELVGLSFAVKPYEAWWVPTPTAERRAAVLQALRPVFENGSIGKIGQNVKFDLLVLMHAAGIEVRGTLYDTMIIHYLLDPEARHGMDFLAKSFLNYEPVPIETLIGKGARQTSMADADPAAVAEYAAEDADVTLRLYGKLWPLLEETQQTGLYCRIEAPLIPVLARMEFAGVFVDRQILGESGAALAVEASRLETGIREVAEAPELNVNSAKQLGEVLFEKLKIDPKPKKTKTGQYRTDEEYLQSLSDNHPVIGKILEYRGLKKLLSTYIEALPQLINPDTGRIHTSFNQAVTATGRLSSTNPNLQNIPIRDAAGREIRRAFTAPDREHVVVSADYSQVELRIMAHLSGDQALRQAFLDGEDVHTATAAKVFGVAPDQVTREQRRRAKTANFGIIYGISAFGLATRLHIPRTEAKELIEGYFTHYPGVKEYMEKVVAEARERGYVETIFGRRRYLRDIRSGNSMTRSLAERNAINAPIQGSAADIMKLAMIEVDRRLRECGSGARIVLQVHDELVLEVPQGEVASVTALVTEAMAGAAELSVPLLVEADAGTSWLDAH
ncbi:DNA polymerase I [Rikenella microfusus]|uniref:DNA polymerase I n=1 Tax=Rikenella microfusus TaxID=28139 RepID=UPI00248D90F2|nr:DNA polymerase I [Rikenella microfusus]